MAKITHDQMQEYFSNALTQPTELFRILFTGKRKGFTPQFKRVEMRPVQVKDGLLINISKKSETQDFTENKSLTELTFNQFWSMGFSHLLIETSSHNMEFKESKSGEILYLNRKSDREIDFSHDKKKKRFVDVRESYLHTLGITDSDAHIKKTMADKYLQIEEFIRLMDPMIKSWVQKNPGKTFTAIDCGSGSGYLTFALERYLEIAGIKHSIVGVEIRPELVEKTNACARDLDISHNLTFVANSIERYRGSITGQSGLSLLFALHACDTATDEALALGVSMNADLMVVSPCCHKDIQGQIEKNIKVFKAVAQNNDSSFASTAYHDPTVNVFLQDGIVREKFCDLLTDTLRKEFLETRGYKSEIIEFIGEAHTGRNLMMRSTRQLQMSVPDHSGYSGYVALKNKWRVNPHLESLLFVVVTGR